MKSILLIIILHEINRIFNLPISNWAVQQLLLNSIDLIFGINNCKDV